MQTKKPAPAMPSASAITRSEITVDGMTCSGCARNVTNAIQGVAGVQSATVSLEQRRAGIRWRSGTTADVDAVIRAVTAAGFSAKPIALEATSDNATARAGLWSNASLLGIIATGLLMIGEWIFRLGDAGWYRWTSLALASLVQFGPGRQFYRGAWNQLKARSSNMDTLVALGSTTAYAYSVWALFTGNAAHLYFMEAAAIITLISVGHLMEARVSARASDSLKALMNLAPATARRRDESGAEQDVAVAELAPGDFITLRAGERVPTDGVVIEGTSAVDESMLTGESIPVQKIDGSTVYTGTINQTGHILLRVTSVGEQTALASIIAAVERAQSSRANIQRLGDRISNVFVPIVVMIAITAGLWWGLLPEQANQTARHLSQYLWHVHPPASPLAAAILAVVAVLIIACPCAMGLATPAAIMAGANAAARRGILIRDGVALEKAGTITAIVFDKTGTLTEGRPIVAERKLFTPAPANPDILTASLASMSNHPLSAALSSVHAERVALTNFVETAGKGLCADWHAPDNNTATKLRLGSLRWLESEGISTTAATTFADQWMSRGATIVAVSADKDIIAAYALRDPLKPGARALVDHIVTRRGEEALGLYLISGDAAPTVQAIAAELGLNRAVRHEAFAAVPPERKAEIVKQLQQRGERVAFVGDGINDGPALEQADLGIAVSRASDVAREAADIILLRSDIEAIPESLALAKATLRTIRQNLFWAFFYNALGIPLAALGFMSPVLCAAAMGLSDLVVIGNALRLRRWGNKPAA